MRENQILPNQNINSFSRNCFEFFFFKQKLKQKMSVCFEIKLSESASFAKLQIAVEEQVAIGRKILVAEN